MKTVAKWWQTYVLGGFKSPQELIAVAASEPAVQPSRFLSTPEDSGFLAPERLAAPYHFNSRSHLSQMDRADYQQTDLRLLRWSALFQEIARKRGVPLYVHSAFRTEAQQAALVAAGHSKAHYPNSAHNTGQAVDIVHGVFHWDLTKQEWAYLSVLGNLALERLNATLPAKQKLKLEWGGSWSFYDPAHWQIAGHELYRPRLPVLAPVRYTPRGILDRIKF